MTRFYFNVENGRSELDPDGTDFADVEQARNGAVVLLGEMITDAYGLSSWNGIPWKVWVSDGPNGTGHVLFAVQLSAI